MSRQTYDPDWSDRQIFATLTYPRNESIRVRWLSVTMDTNRFIQKIRRDKLFGELEYLRCLEPHKDGYPHAHLHIRFKNCHIRDRGIYLRDVFRQRLKEHSSKFGHTDFQCCRNMEFGTIRYIVKYLAKNKGASRLWQLVLGPRIMVPSSVNELGYPLKPLPYASWKLISIGYKTDLFKSQFKWKKIKLLSWSRGYPSTFVRSPQSRSKREKS